MSYSQMAQQIADYFKTQPVVKVWIFGSFARGEENANSDVDLLIQFDHSTPIGLFSYARMHRELEERLGRKVDLVEEGTLRPAAAAAALPAGVSRSADLPVHDRMPPASRGPRSLRPPQRLLWCGASDP